MSESSSKRSSTGSGSSSSTKARKSKNEIIRTTLGIYLKQRNYSVSEKFRKSDFTQTETMKETAFNMMLDDDLAKVNSFTYSNVLCLNKNLSLVDHQFTKFVAFIQKQNVPVKTELQTIISPLYCYLYIEMLKGNDAQPAMEFLKKFAHLVGPVESLSSILPNKVNGKNVPVLSDIALTTAGQLPSGSTQITFVREPENEGNSAKEYFQDLVQTLSICLRLEELDSMDITRNFRYAKYELELSVRSVYALKHFLIHNGHVMIVHILQTWFSIEITDVRNTEKASDNELLTVETTIVRNEVIFKKPLPAVGSFQTHASAATTASIQNNDQPKINQKLQTLRKAVLKLKSQERPMRFFNVMNADNRLSSADMDSMDCHLACGFDDSTVKLWQINQSTMRGRKPYVSHTRRHCPWSLDNDCLELSSTDDDSDDPTNQGDTDNHLTLPRVRRKRAVNRKIEQQDDEPASENILTDSGEHILRGHSKGVTGVLFCKQQPLLVSVSKDTTMRAWTSNNFSSAAIYRGHNYPIWCVAESPVGTYLATGSKDRTARLWSTDREFPLQTYIGHKQDVDTIAFHPNGNYIATGSTDLTVRLWCVTSGKLLRVFTDSHLPVQCVSFSPDGKLLASAGEETKIRIFDLAAGSQMGELKDHSAPVTNFAWSKDGTRIASCCADGSVRIYNVQKLNGVGSATSTTSPGSSSSSSSSFKPTLSSVSGSKRCAKIFFNENGNISCIGSS